MATSPCIGCALQIPGLLLPLQLLIPAMLPAMLHLASVAGGASMPAAFDLRNVDGKNFLSPVRNHHLPINSGCASCWSVTTASVLGDRLNMLIDKAGVRGAGRIEVSAQYLLNCVPGQRRCGYPGSAGAAMQYVMQHGIPDESCAPWQNAWDGRTATKPYGVQQCDPLHICAQMMIDPKTGHPASFPNHTNHLQPVDNPRMYHIVSNNQVPPNNTQAIMEALQTGPVPCGIHADPLVSYTKGIMIDPDGGMTSDDHSVAIVGWGAEAGTPYWVVQNNWCAQLHT